jgi:farnesyl diphosphate synthase
MVKLLAVAAGSRGMAGGQQIDLESTGKSLALPELEFMHIHKTGALIRAAVLLGALCGKALAEAERAKLDRYAKAVGLAFQVVDDLLDAEASTATLGKTAGKDSRQGKSTYVSLLGVHRARELAQELRAEALGALEGLGSRAARLSSLADFVVLRKF